LALRFFADAVLEDHPGTRPSPRLASRSRGPPNLLRISERREALTKRLCCWIVAVSLTGLVLGCGGGEEPMDFKDNAALSRPRPGMEAMKKQMLEAFRKAKRDPAKVAPNLVE
jgi:hypothetical protein